MINSETPSRLASDRLNHGDAWKLEVNMLDYARQRAVDALRTTQTAVLVTSGPAGIQAGMVLCEAVGITIYLLLPQTSDHLFNLEQVPSVTLLADGWTLKGEAWILPDKGELDLGLYQKAGAEWCLLVRVDPCQVQVRREQGWGNLETIDFS